MTDDLIRRREAVHVASEEDQCPIPSAHDKLSEAHYFIHELIENYHHPHEFRYSLSAFFQAARSTTLMIQSELAHHPGFEDWWKAKQDSLREDPELRLLNDLRVVTFHKSSLIPDSTMFVGHFKYGNPKSGLLMPLPPMMPTLYAFLLARRELADWEHPHRLWSGEEFGIQRCWKLQEIPKSELVEFCVGCWEKIASVVSETHAWLGFKFEPEAKCKHWSSEYRSVRESEIFSEVAEAWEAPPTELVKPRKDTLSLLADPRELSDVLYRISPGSSVKGWVGGPSPLWDRAYASMLVYSIDDTVIEENTCVFLKMADATIEPLQEADGTGDDE
jgi:hypothetical protein